VTQSQRQTRFLRLRSFTSDFTRAFWLASAVSDTRLYIDGGEYYEGTDTSATNYFNQLSSTLIIDTTTSWTTSSVTFTPYGKPNNFPYARRPCLWFDNETNKLYSWSGWPYSEPAATLNIWELDVDTNGVPTGPWSQSAAPASNVVPPWGNSYAPVRNRLYSVGGFNPYYNLYEDNGESLDPRDGSICGCTIRFTSLHEL